MRACCFCATSVGILSALPNLFPPTFAGAVALALATCHCPRLEIECERERARGTLARLFGPGLEGPLFALLCETAELCDVTDASLQRLASMLACELVLFELFSLRPLFGPPARPEEAMMRARLLL